MKIVAISDVHTKISKVTLPSGDLLLIAGDLTLSGTIQELIKFNSDLEVIKPLYKNGIVCIAGNHDWLFQKQHGVAKSLVTNAQYLEDELIEICGIKIWGSPYSKWYYDWAFNLHPGKELQDKWSKIPDNIDIVMTHGPCFNILDRVPRGESVGDKDLLDAILRAKPKFHICGHIHNGYGMKKFHDITFINASSCDESYAPINPPIEFEI